MDGKADPPVCKIEVYEPKKEAAAPTRNDREKKKKANKPKPLKEIIVGVCLLAYIRYALTMCQCLIDKHDLDIKARKIKEFLESGHQVKLTIFGKKHQLLKHPLAMDSTTLKVFEAVESFVDNVRPPSSSAPNRVEFVFMPKTKSGGKTASD